METESLLNNSWRCVIR